MSTTSSSPPRSAAVDASPLLAPRVRRLGRRPSLRGAARFLRRASSRRMMREPSMLVRETAAEQLEERQSNWAYSRPVVYLDILWNLAFVAVAAAVLFVSRDEMPSMPLRLWIVGYAFQCVFHMICVCVEYHRRVAMEGSGRGSSEGSSPRDVEEGSGYVSEQSQIDEGTSQPSPYLLFNSRLRNLRFGDHTEFYEAFDPVPGYYHRSAICWMHEEMCPIYSGLLKMLMTCDTCRGVAKHLESANTMFSFIWWIIGFYWVSAGGQALTHDAPHLYWLCIVFLAFDVFFVVFCVALACVIGIAVCCCLPCIIAILYAVADQEGASEDDIRQLPKYKFRRVGDTEKLGDTSIPSGGIMAECGSDPPIEHFLPAEDAECCICLSAYDDGVELRELPCGHHFHSACIDKWLYINATCPLCKYNITKSGSISGREEVLAV